MNLSGKAVRYHLKKHNIPIENLLVIVDDKDLPLGTLRLKPKGTGGTHNGINDIVTTLNTLDFARLRIGIGSDFAKGFQINYVLGKFTEEEKKLLRPNIELSIEIVKNFVTQGLDKTMNLYNK
jgi:PTH1 family peptidyl-tRNA hydrolase